MNITLTQPTSATLGIIAISIQESDYQSRIDALLKEASRKTILPGFRPGKAPVGLLRKIYGKSIVAEEVEAIATDALKNYIEEKKFWIVGEPILDREKAGRIDWETQKEFDFEFKVALVNDFFVDLSPSVSIPYYEVTVTDEMIDEAAMDLREDEGDPELPEMSRADDYLGGELRIGKRTRKNFSTLLGMLSEEEVKPFLGLKIGESITMEIAQLSEKIETRMVFLGLSEEEAVEAKGKFTLTIREIWKRKPAELNEEFFAAVFEDPEVKTEEEFLAKVKEMLIRDNEEESEGCLNQSIKNYYLEHTAISLPEDFFRERFKLHHPRFLISDELLEEEFLFFIKNMKWDLIVNKIATENHIVIDKSELIQRTNERILFDELAEGDEHEDEDEYDEYEEEGEEGEEEAREEAAAAAEEEEQEEEQEEEEDSSGYPAPHLTHEEKERYLAKVHRMLLAERVVDFIKEKITVYKKEVSTDEFWKQYEAERQ